MRFTGRGSNPGWAPLRSGLGQAIYICVLCGTESELVEAVLECIECLADDCTLMGGRFSGFALLMMMSIVYLFNVCFDICFAGQWL